MPLTSSVLDESKKKQKKIKNKGNITQCTDGKKAKERDHQTLCGKAGADAYIKITSSACRVRTCGGEEIPDRRRRRRRYIPRRDDGSVVSHSLVVSHSFSPCLSHTHTHTHTRLVNIT